LRERAGSDLLYALALAGSIVPMLLTTPALIAIAAFLPSPRDKVVLRIPRDQDGPRKL
jgi:hypothetical protein